jgi:hypothetical protein
MDTLVQVAGDRFAEGAIEDAPRDEGILIQGISTEHTGLMKVDVLSSSPYSAYVEFGTRRRVVVPPDLISYAAQFKGSGKGTGQGFFEHILGWVQRHHIRFESAGTTKSGKVKLLTIEQTAFIIYHFLLIRGTHPHPYFFKQRPLVMKLLTDSAKGAVKQLLK